MEYQYSNPNNAPVQGGPQPPYGQFTVPPIDNRRVERKRISAVSLACGFAILGFIGLSLVVGALLRMFIPEVNSLFEDSFFNDALNMFSSAVMIFVPFLIAYRVLDKKKIAGDLILGTAYDRTNFRLIIPIAFMVCIIGSFATSYLAQFVDWAFGIEFTVPDDYSNYSSLSGILMSVVSTAIIPAFVEEFAIRGLVMQSLRRYGDWFAIIMSSLVFAIMHGNMIQIPFAFIAGIGIGYAVVKTGTMWTGIIIHFLNNFISVVSLAVYANCNEAQTTIFSGVLYGAVFLIGGICLYVFSKRNPRLLTLSKGSCRYLTTGEKVRSFIFAPTMLIAIGVLCYETSMYIN